MADDHTPPSDSSDMFTSVPEYPDVEYRGRTRRTGGAFDELDPTQSDYKLVASYLSDSDRAALSPGAEPTDLDSGQLSAEAMLIRHTWMREILQSETTPDIDLTDTDRLTRLDRATGILLGLTCGDALGRPVEFLSRTQIQRRHGTVTNFLSNGSHNQPAGTVTDDSQLAIYLVANLIENGGFNQDHYAAQLVEWYESEPFDVGNTTRLSIEYLQEGLDPETAGQKTLEERGPDRAAGNGSIMRCAPLAIAYPDDQTTLQRMSRASSVLTHADPRCTHGCAALNLVLAGFIRGEDDPLTTARESLSDAAPSSLVERLERLPDGVTQNDLENSGFVLDTLEAALYYGVTAESPEDAIVTAVNQGGDADTVGAIAGAIAGARFGATPYDVPEFVPTDIFPARWINNLQYDVGVLAGTVVPQLLEIGQLSNHGIGTSSQAQDRIDRWLETVLP